MEENRINKCQKCGKEILDGDKYCSSCYIKNIVKRIVIVIIMYIVLFIVAIICAEIEYLRFITIGIMSPVLVVPLFYLKDIFKAKTIRRIYKGIPLTYSEFEKIDNENRKYYKKLSKARTNYLDDYPEYVRYFKKPFNKTKSIQSKPLIYSSMNTSNSKSLNVNNDLASKKHDNTINSKSSSNKKPVLAKIMCILLSITLIASMIGLIYQHNRIITQQEKIDTQQDQIEQLSRSVEVNREHYKEYYDDAMAYQSYKFRSVFINPNDKYYHKQSCSIYDDDTCRFCDFILARQLGYEPCPYCS